MSELGADVFALIIMFAVWALAFTPVLGSICSGRDEYWDSVLIGLVAQLCMASVVGLPILVLWAIGRVFS